MADHAETTGWDGLYVYDHFMPFDEGGAPRSGPVLEGWTTLTAIAGRTERLRLGTLVLGNLYRHPALVANMAATLDQISNGRVVLGIGAGWQRNEHDAYGIALPAPSLLVDQFEEACAVISLLLLEESSTFSGHYYTLTGAPCEPKPVQRRLPLLIGASGERRMLAVVAQWADEWNAWTTPDVFRRKSGIVDRCCESIGRDPASIRRTTQAVIELVGDHSTRGEPDPQTITGTTSELADTMAEYERAGCDEFIVPDDYTVSIVERLDTLDQLKRDVFGR